MAQKRYAFQIVSRYIEDNWKWVDSADPKRIRTLGTFASESTGPASQKNWGPSGKSNVRQLIGKKATGRNTLSDAEREEAIERLQGMGFTEEASRSVLATEANFDKAVNTLLSLGNSARAPFEVRSVNGCTPWLCG